MWEKEEFTGKAVDTYVLVSLDFPNGEEAKAAVPNPERNQELVEQYGIEGYPTVLLMTPEGEVFGRSGYTGATPEEYLEDVLTQRTEGKAALAKIKEIAAAFDTAEDKIPVVKKAIAQLKDLGDGIGAQTLATIVRKGLELDPEDKADIKISAFTALLASNQATVDESAAAAAADPANEHGLLEAVTAAKLNTLRELADLEDFLVAAGKLFDTGKVHDKEVVRDIYVASAFFCKQYLDKPEDAKSWAQRAKDMGDLNDRQKEVIKEILGEDPA